jgi:hypothetical protein
VIRKIVLQSISLVRKCSIGPKTQFATVQRPLPMTCSQLLSLHDRDDHLCRDGGANGRYFEGADRGAGLTHAPTFGARSSARLAVLRPELARSTSCMTRRASQVWRGSADTCVCGCMHVTQSDGLWENTTSCRTLQASLPAACSTRRALE